MPKGVEIENTVWTKDLISETMKKHDKAVITGLIKIYERQTADEQNEGYTKHHNGIGFNGVDGDFMSSLARIAIKSGSLSEKQMLHARKKMKKYAGQLFTMLKEAYPDNIVKIKNTQDA